MKYFIIIFFFSCFLLTGCVGLKNIQDLTYIVAIGMDYDEEKGEYIAYLQGLNFASVAKQEGARTGETPPNFIASATGETLNLAVGKLYKTSEPPLYFGHVKTVVLTNRLIQSKSKEVLEEIGRNRSLRPTLRIVTTEEDIHEVFNVKALFDYPAIYTVLFKERREELATDELKPTTLMEFLKTYYEPMGIAKLPSIKIDRESWTADKAYPVLYLMAIALFNIKSM